LVKSNVSGKDLARRNVSGEDLVRNSVLGISRRLRMHFKMKRDKQKSVQTQLRCEII